MIIYNYEIEYSKKKSERERRKEMDKWKQDYEHSLVTPLMRAEELPYVPFPLDVIEDDEHLLSVMRSWKERGIKEVAVDLEFESTLHYPGVNQLCTVQVFDKEKYYLIDGIKLAQPSLLGLKEFFETNDFLKLWFATESDRFILKKHGYKLLNTYDIQKIPCPVKGRSLTVFVENLLGEKLSGDTIETLPKDKKKTKSKKSMQRSNWVIRPIPLEQIVYSLNDVKYLFRLRDAALSAPKIINPKLFTTEPRYAALNPNDKGIACSVYRELTCYSCVFAKPVKDFFDIDSFISLVLDFGVAFPEKSITKDDIVPCFSGIPEDKSNELAAKAAEIFNQSKAKQLRIILKSERVKV